MAQVISIREFFLISINTDMRFCIINLVQVYFVIARKKGHYKTPKTPDLKCIHYLQYLILLVMKRLKLLSGKKK